MTSEYLNMICEYLTYWFGISKFMQAIPILDKEFYLLEIS